MGTSFTISHPLRRTSFFLLLDRGGEKEALPESRQAFEVAVARTSGVVNVRASRASVYWRANGHNWARCTKRTDCILASCSTTYPACSKKILLDSGKLLGGWLFHRALIKQRHSRWHHLLISAGSAFVLEAKYSFFFLLVYNWIPETKFVSNECHYFPYYYWWNIFKNENVWNLDFFTERSIKKFCSKMITVNLSLTYSCLYKIDTYNSSRFLSPLIILWGTLVILLSERDLVSKDNKIYQVLTYLNLKSIQER